MQQSGALHLGSTQLRGTRLGNRTAKQKPFISARRAKRSHSTQGSKAVTNIFGGSKKSGGTLLIKLPQLPGSGGKDGQESGTLKMRKGQKTGGPDPNTIFVAGATGRLGARIVRELLSQGYRVRAGVRSIDKAENFVRTAANFGLLSGEELALLDVIPYNLEQPETFEGAIGNAGRVVCAVGAAESEFANLSSPKKIDGEGTIGLVEAAAKAGVTQFVLVTSLGTGKLGFPAAILNVFGGVLIYKRKAEEALERSGIPYVIVRPGGMERPRDDFKVTHNVRLAPRDQLFGGQVSRLQVAELVGACLGSPEAAQNKVLEVVAEAEAPALSWEDLLGSIPQEESAEEREARRERGLELLEQLEEAREKHKLKLEAAEAQLATIKARVGAANGEAAELKKQEAAVRKEQADVLKQAQGIEVQLAKLSADANLKSRQAAAAKAVLAAAQQAQREQRVLPAAEIVDIKASIFNPPKPKEEKQESGTVILSRGLSGLFGGRKAAQGQKQEEVEEEVEEEEEEPAAAPKPSGLGGLFGRSAAPKKEQPAEEEEEEEEEVVAKEEPAPAAVAKKAAGGLRGLFGAKQQEQEEAAATVQTLIAEEDGKAAQAKKQAEDEERKQAEAKAAAEQKAKEREEKAKAEAESRAKAEAAEAKARADAQAKAKAAAERRAKERAQEDAKRKPVPVAVAAALFAPAVKAAEAAAETVDPDFKPFSGLLDYFGLGALGASPAAPEGAPPKAQRVLPTGRGTPKEQTPEEKEAANAKALEKVDAKKAQRAAAVPTGRGAPKAEQAQQAPAPAAGGGDDRKAVEAAAAKNAAEARAWIQAWRERTAAAGSAVTPAAGGGSHANGAVAPKATGASQKAAEAKQAKVAAGNGAGPAHAAESTAGQDVATNVKEARDWIDAWKAKQSAK
ncbi:hypothetical protein N2152v2_001640 [Parachlorella kessleri]